MRRISIAFVLVVAGLWLTAPPALAHTAFESSDPADGTTVESPISQITIVFSGEAEPAGDGFIVLDPDGRLRVPDRIASADKLTWLLQFDEPLAGGTVGVRWRVAAPDTHPIDGSFSFTVPDTAPSASVGGVEGDTEPSQRIRNEATTPTEGSESLDDFLNSRVSHAPFLSAFGVISRTLSLLGAMIAIGGVAFAAIVLRGSERDIRSVLFWVRRASVVLLIGALAELIHQLATVNGNWTTVWPPSSLATVLWSPVGLAIGLRLVGAGLMLRAHLDVVPAKVAADPVLALQAAIPVGAGPRPTGPVDEPTEPYQRPDDLSWRVDGELAIVFAGVVAVLAAFAFDGHTLTEGVRALTSLMAMAHAAAGAVWAGGLVMLAHVVWLRHRREADSRSVQLAVRFSVVAAIALVIAGGAGTLLAMTILDSVSELWTTPWGRVLLAKIGLVAVAAAAGGYNHKVLIPRMMSLPPHDPKADAEFRRAATIEGAALLLVIVLTAVLVAAAS